MISDEIIESARQYAWVTISPDELGGLAPTMLSLTERQMLNWFTRNLPFDGCVVDAGAFLGGSTLALASGLARNERRSTIYSYDMFVAPNDQYSLEKIGNDRAPGDSVLDLFWDRLKDYKDLIVVEQGDFLSKSAPEADIDLLFVDIAKTWQLNDKINQSFFPKLVPGHSVVIQQDTNDHSCPWVNITMEFFSDYFEMINDDSASRSFVYRKQIPPALLNTDLANLPLVDKLQFMKDSAARASSPVSEFLCRTSAAWIIFESCGASDALQYLSDIDKDQPWSGESYVSGIASAITSVKDIAGFKNYIDGYFNGQT